MITGTACSRAEVSPFQRRVYDAICRVPRGRVTTYQRVASFLGMRCPRAVGQALRRNPFAPRVPCHRVIAANLDLGGFAGHTAGTDILRKRRLLAAEGVAFSADGKLTAPAMLWDFPDSPDAPGFATEPPPRAAG